MPSGAAGRRSYRGTLWTVHGTVRIEAHQALIGIARTVGYSGSGRQCRRHLGGTAGFTSRGAMLIGGNIDSPTVAGKASRTPTSRWSRGIKAMASPDSTQSPSGPPAAEA